MITTQIQLGNNGFLDLEDDVAIPFTFAINEIRDIATKGSSYSKTIRLIGTANNRQLLGQLFDVNIVDSSFNINIKTPCTVLRNGIPIFEGLMQLNSVDKLEEDNSVFFNVTIIDPVGDLYTALGDYELEDITFDWTPYNHLYNIQSITATSLNTAYNSVYKYHLFSNGKQEYNLQDFKPSIWAKKYFDAIFADAGYTYEWDSISSTGFDKLIIPSNVDLPKLSDSEIAASSFRAGWTSPQLNLDFLTLGNKINIIPNADSSGPLNDPSNMYSISNGYITSNFAGTLDFKLGFWYRLYLQNDGTEQVYLVGRFEDDGSGNSVESDAYFTVKTYVNYSDVNLLNSYGAGNMEYGGYELIQPPTTISRLQVAPGGGQTTLAQGTSPSFDMTKNTVIGEIIRMFTYVNIEIDGFWGIINTCCPTNPLPFIPLSQANNNFPKLKLEIGFNSPDYSNNFLIVSPSNAIVTQNSTIFLQNFIPKQVKQKDFISSIIKMFNLYFVPDKSNPKKIIIKTRDDFYDQGPILDWTDKIDIGTDVKIDFLPDLQNASILWSHKDDTNDSVAKQYKESQNQVYGQYRYVFDNEWVSEEKKIETTFSVAPLVPDYAGNVVTTGGFKNLRILYDGGLKPGNWRYRINSTYPGNFITGQFFIKFTQYPYAGHFDDPLEPTLDFNFGLINDITYNNWDYLTNNNLYNRFWSRTVEQIRTGKLYTAKVFLKEEDILKLDLSSKIWIRDTYWFINKIKDYDPNNPGPTTVEFLSVEQFNFSPQKRYITKPGNLYNQNYNGSNKPYQRNESQYGLGVVGTIETGNANSVNTGVKDTIIAGDGNSIGGTNVLVFGDGNNNIGRKNAIFGDNNTVMADNVFLFGLNNVRADQSGVNLLGTTLNYVNYIEAGRNQVINKYPSTKIINFIDAGRDTVRGIGSLSIETNINAGRDQII